MNNNILVTGGNGQLGSEIKGLAPHYPQHRFYFTDASDLDICNKEMVSEFVTENKIGTIINCAAYTAVDKAESESELADKINHLAVESLAKISKNEKIRLIHISTDYVFDGKGHKPYTPDHQTQPVNWYGETKLRGELAIKEINPENSIIIRTSWVYSSFGNNFVKTMLRLGQERQELNVIYDQIGAPTYAKDLAEFILNNTLKSTNEEIKTYQFTNEGVCSWFDFAKEIMTLAEIDCKINPIPTSAYPTPAKRPFYSLMDKTSLKEDFKVQIPYWKESLRECVEKMVVSSRL